MKILFINPSLRRGSPTKYLPVGIAAVMTFARERGYDFDLLDIDINDYDDVFVDEFLERNRYDVILTGCIVTHYKWMKWLTNTIKNYHPDTKTVVGNSVAGSIPEVFLRHSSADIAIIGEGEFGAVDVLDALQKGDSFHEVPGIAFLDGEKFVRTPQRKACKINELPIIDWSGFDVERYFEKSFVGADGLTFEEGDEPRVMPVSTARGCVFRCTFCHFVFWDDPYRHRSADSILAEIERNIHEYNATYINFWDDLSFSSLNQAEVIADAIIASKLEFNWNAAIRVDLFGNPRWTRERRVRVAKKFREAGCLNVGFSLESANREILEMMNKHIEPEHFSETVSVMREADITCSNSVVFGYPLETPATIKETFDMCLEAAVYPSIGFLLPLPYTGMYTYAKQHGFITDDDAYLESITERQDICLNMTQMTDQEIMDGIKDGAEELNESLKLGLRPDRLVRTGGYRNHTKKTAQEGRPPLDPDNLKRNENDVSFNYSQALFEIDLGVKAADEADNGNEGKSVGLPVIDVDKRECA